ncbi:VWA domain-containing protein [Colwellia sp. 4_MG-2023]|jgi:Ca-activated chloride channel family protein|uniref:vWA domain-containing protein n=1 Tax=unclassified Colwellia TaxID=196834 RepID=UPI001C098076|nr:MULTISPECIES: VWA domain-containing protein [unclassified Colwellia]MBU2925771.1 VWA domain-containing protein [Colwellia sp. C2M11]MDO6488554.1 VWA domain-containing protein [Colwellia sp. 6_MG-2023]MDO6505579.1 VWA domain-containing protein [Colwellia sp. 5_MG-2023]MDO6554125.1 VWA domain-containing protein [Colwellia sp. 4_MG-2023]MDO6651003.1 VWA domain-containing protein [Colwellia sp. 3_MG-2023]
MITFAWPWLLLLLPLPLLVYWLPKKDSTQVSAALIMPQLIDSHSVDVTHQQNKKAPLIVLTLCWLLTVLALSQPQWLGDAIDIPTEGREMMIAVDLSGSMQIEDMQLNGNTVNRLNMLKVVLGDFIQRRVGDRLGLILFADDAYMQTPMTFDRKTVKQMLDESVLGLVGQKTAIGDAIGLAVKRFDAKQKSNKVLLLLTDGQNTAGKISPEQALELAIAKDITIYSIGIGADVMLQKSLFGTRRVNPSSELDEQTLTKLAEETGGKYFRARDGQDMSEIYQLLDQLEPLEQEQQQMRPLTALFYFPLALALLISMFYFLAINFTRFNRK